jgi:hypothetical protein
MFLGLPDPDPLAEADPDPAPNTTVPFTHKGVERNGIIHAK